MKNILVLSPTFPFPLDLGSKIRIYNIIEQLSAGHVVDLAAVSTEAVDRDYVDEMKQFCDEVIVSEIPNRRYLPFLKTFLSGHPYRVHKFHSKKSFLRFRRLMERKVYDIIWCNNLNMASYLNKDGFDRDACVILDTINEDELVWKTYRENSSFFLKKLFAKKNISNLRRFRAGKRSLFDLVLSVSHRDREFTQTWLPSDIEIDVVPNGIAAEFLDESVELTVQSENKNILFCGSMDIAMNREAVRRFVSCVLPNVRRYVPETKFWVVGRNPPRSISKLACEHIAVTGRVADVKPYYRQAAVSVAPFEFGGGTKLKIIESLALGVPLVATSIGVQGIDVLNGEHLLIRDDWENFACAITELLRNKNLRRELVIHGRKFIKERYTWEAIMKDFFRRHQNIFC